ncbi:hypothetical protein Vadar_024850 [Vaccinium darrowii]|uniref:Uncharacterized protein n=1 Tax=Vaccinium darrowii TaxID=229202 RepID=A0ACB7XC97_9ERIC|nr:hypothetical protein Vadar_024850 [Vaccinium darrowii]
MEDVTGDYASNFPMLEVPHQSGDGRANKGLNDELGKLRRDLEEKEQLLAATRVSTTNTGTPSDLPPKSWVDKVATGVQEVGLVVPPSVDECKGSAPPVLSPVASLKSKSEVNIKCAEGHQSALVMAITDVGVEASSSTNVISPVQCSVNKFSALLETEARVEVEDIQLPTDAGLIQDIIPPISPPKKRGRVNKCSLMGVFETKVRLENLQSTVAQCFPTGWNFMHNYNGGPVARIILGWDSGKMSVSSIFQSDQLVVVDIELLESKKKFMVSIVYGYNKSVDRKALWSDMRSVYSMAGNRAWIQMGDFNSVRLTSERLVGFDAKAADKFNDCLTYISQDDLPSKEFEQILHSSWSEPLEGRPMFVLAAKLKRLKGILKQLNLRSFSNITRRVIVARDQLEIAQQQLFATPFDRVVS